MTTRDVPITVTCHGADVRLLLGLSPALRAMILRTLLDRNVTFRLVAEALLEALLARLDLPLARAFAARAYVKPPCVTVAGVKRHADIEFPYLIISGRLVPSKRADVALGALQHLPPPWRLVVVGDGPQQSHLACLADDTLRGRVHFLGHVPRSEALRWVAGAKVMVHPSEVDAAPTAVLEALALGVPVVSGGAGDVAKWPGVHVVARTPQAFAFAAQQVSALG